MTRRNLLALIFAAVLTTGCATPPKLATGSWIDPCQAVLRAAEAPRLGVTGVFAITVKATGRTDKVHLNSETDYRDTRNLSIAVLPATAAQLETLLGAPPELALRGKRILVSGTARRTRIDFLVDDRPSGKYYYQTHVRVADASQIQVPVFDRGPEGSQRQVASPAASGRTGEQQAYGNVGSQPGNSFHPKPLCGSA